MHGLDAVDFGFAVLDFGDRAADFGLQGFHLLAEFLAVVVDDTGELLELRDHLLSEVIHLDPYARELACGALDLGCAFLRGRVGHEALRHLLDASVDLVEVIAVREERLEAFLVDDDYGVVVKDVDGGSGFLCLFHC